VKLDIKDKKIFLLKSDKKIAKNLLPKANIFIFT